MTKTLIFILLLYSSNILSQRVCDSLIGVGFLQIPKSITFEIYNEDSTVFMKINRSTLEKKYDFIKNDRHSEFVKIMCLEETDSSYFVLVDDHEKNKKIILKNANIQLQKMEDYILNSTIICERDKLKNEINGQAIQIKGEFIRPVKIEGDWLQVESYYLEKYPYIDDSPKNRIIENAWVRWKLDDVILISVMYLR